MARELGRKCSRCGLEGHNSRTCNESGKTCFMLFGVNILKKKLITGSEETMKKSCSTGNLSFSDVENRNNNENHEAGYLSDGHIHNNRRQASHEKRRGRPWTEQEHRVFLAGLRQLGKGDWKGISRNFVRSRTPTQVASHAQKYFLRLSANERRKHRPSVFDMPLVLQDEEVAAKDSSVSPVNKTSGTSLELSISENVTLTVTAENTPQSSDQNKMVNQFPLLGLSSPWADPVVPATGFPNYHVIPYKVKVPRNLPFAHLTLSTPGLAYSPKFHGSFDNFFPAFSHPSGIPSPRSLIPHHSSSHSEHAAPSTENDALDLKIGQPRPTKETKQSLKDFGAIRVN